MTGAATTNAGLQYFAVMAPAKSSLPLPIVLPPYLKTFPQPRQSASAAVLHLIAQFSTTSASAVQHMMSAAQAHDPVPEPAARRTSGGELKTGLWWRTSTSC